MPRLTNICVFLACGLMLYSATYLSNPVPRRRAQPSVQPGEAPAATDDEIARVRRQLDEAQRREERTRELLRATQEQASRTGPAPVAVPAAVDSGPSERPAAAARQVNAGIVLDGTLESALKLAAPTGPGFLMLTFSNSALKEHLYNFVAHAKGVAAAHVVGAVDVETFDLLREMTAVYKTPLAASSFQVSVARPIHPNPSPNPNPSPSPNPRRVELPDGRLEPALLRKLEEVRHDAHRR